MYTVKLNQLEYYAFHGLHKQESKCGNHFEVNLTVSQNRNLTSSNNINELIDYSKLKGIVDVYMKDRFDLLEDIIAQVITDIKKLFNEVSGEISIKKLNPLFGGSCHSSEVVVDF